MAGIRFTDEQVAALASNPWVKSATPRYVSFTKEFMEEFVRLHADGKSRYEIFEEHGLPVAVIGKSAIKHATDNWVRKSNKGAELSDSKRGGRPKGREMTKDEVIAQQRAKIEMLERENELLRPIRRLERRHQPSKSPSETDTR